MLTSLNCDVFVSIRAGLNIDAVQGNFVQTFDQGRGEEQGSIWFRAVGLNDVQG